MTNLISLITTIALMASANTSTTKDKIEVWCMSLVRVSDGVCYCVDENGNGWEFYGENYKCGQVLVTLNSDYEIVNAY